ncbi:TetR/AcrR family transcriptional regulator [Nocardia yunnanensis]|uniref:TetR/AcrR family transcriptional regulator n=1 Tax=Nocardia yunnanensis TaxID=2382165 RepID=A0A386ZL85_9NOCA|nr:TetR/AcrR family transcriptional regulator [Nocardia yunnanensis]AYF78377.1 TetR/AcrR family transcriptional regulator [Nocardia yunnanensis]
MGQKGAETRDRLLDATQELVEAGGYFGTGLNQVIARSGAPRGSLYFHFPGGKDQLVGESVRRAGAAIGDSLGALADSELSTPEFVAAVLRQLGERLESSAWRQGCPVATVALETAASHDSIQEACSEVYASWEDALRARLAGQPGGDDLVTAILALIEGALLLARAHRSREPLERVGRQIAVWLG